MTLKQTSSILVVDDNEMNVDVLTAVLESDGYEVYTAYGGKVALELVQQHPIDLILLDINMPVMNGFEVCEALKANPETEPIPVMFISALDNTDGKVRGLDVGAVDYIVKPFKTREVLARVRTQLTVVQQRHEIEAMRNRERAQFEKVDRMRREFIGSATHDLKNPLFIISGYADMLATYPEITAHAHLLGHIQAINRSADKMMVLVGDMLELLQMETTVTLTLEATNFSFLLHQSVRDMRSMSIEKQLDLALHLPDEDVMLMLDEARMGRVIENILSNAIKYTPSGGRVDVTLTETDETATLKIEDTGLGIPVDVLPTIFEPFERVKTTKHLAQEGTGLGLSIVKMLVEQHGGTIEVASVLGEGSCFTITLPNLNNG